MNFDYCVIQKVLRKNLFTVVDCELICRCMDFSTASRVCYALTSSVQLEDDRYYMEFDVELQIRDEDPF